MGVDNDESPLYKGQDVFDLENDNNDMKFVSRMRINQDDFNFDLFIHIFSFLTPQNLLKLQRISKKFQSLISNESLWKELCFKEGIYELSTKTWKGEYIDSVLTDLSFILTQSSFWEAFQNDEKSLMTPDPTLSVGTSYEINPWLEFTLKKPLYIDNIDILHIPFSIGGWGQSFTNNTEFQYLEGDTWKLIVVVDQLEESNLEPTKFKVQKKAQKFRLAYNNGNYHYLGLSYIKFNRK